MKPLLLVLLLTPSAPSQQPAQQLPLQLAITFDDLPAHGALPPNLTRLDIASQLLATIRRENLPPIYGFINSAKVADDPASESVLKAWRDAGQPLGSHTWSHPNLDTMSAQAFEADILKNEPLLEKYMPGPQDDWHWFRYPFLHEGDTVEKRREVLAFLHARHYQVAEVSMDFEDYLWNAPYARCLATHDTAAIQNLEDGYLDTASQYLTLFRTVTRQVYGRDIPYILLLHVGAFDAHMFPRLLELYRRRGFTFISLPEASRDAAYAPANDPDIGMLGGGAIQELMMQKLRLKWPPNSKPYKQLEDTCK